MDTQLNGLLQRNSIINTCWLLQVCIVVTVGAGLVSCTKEQKAQGIIQPTQAIQPVRPCHPTGVSSSGTPEFCVNVTEIQLLNHETQADVRLSLMNRTGHRLYIALIGPTSLTDSSGKKWTTGDSMGLGGTNTPVSIDPNEETQGTISFYKNGEAPADLNFSLRGEIGIMTMDSRGQAVPGQIAIKRGIYLSGIHLQQQPHQSTGAMEQHKDTKPGHVSPRRANLTAPKPSGSSKASAPGAVVDVSGSGKPHSQKLASANIRHSSDKRSSTIDPPAASAATSKSGSRSVGSGGSGPDVIGLRIGMTPDQARQRFKSHGFGSSTKSPNRPFDSYTESSNTLTFTLPGQAPQPVPHTKYVAQISGAISDIRIPATENSGDVVTIFFGPIPGEGGIVLLNRTEYLPASKRPTVAAFAKTLVEKYGTPTEMQPGSPGIYRWRYDSSGTLYKPTPATSFVGCPRLKPGIVEFQPARSSLMMQEYKQSVPKCGAIFLEVDVGFADFKYAGPETLIKNYTIHITGLDATIRALEAAKEIVDKIQAEASAVAIKKG
ncbi:MAG TPA: hypothetical protein VJU54_08185 [Nitrospiraceae bacterium]|nr:hypothetical protein [Nitrospiraceae bacterium]